MSRTTIDFGIDLGTSTSEIACMEKGELVVIKHQATASEVTPSAVKMDAKGTIVVGQEAYDRLEADPDNAVGEFKRWMGSADHTGFAFKKAGKRMNAAELSAEVLKVLKASAMSRLGDQNISAAVITVPAMFLIPACEDTKSAAKLAGIDMCPLIQEPVAAAMAYGYRAENLKGNILVFDLGGGTFDTTILSVREGRMVVVGCDGDDKLGGKDYDWCLAHLIADRISAEYPHLERLRKGSSERWATAKLKNLAERAKKALSLTPTVNVEVQGLRGDFEEVDTVIEVTASDLRRETQHLTDRCIAITTQMLKKATLSTDDLATVLVVGGQTQTPYIREMVARELGKAEYRIDPLTVVASGAALFASTQRLPSRKAKEVSPGEAEIIVAYNPVSNELDADIALAVKPSISGATVNIERLDGGWSSGAIPLPANGRLDTVVVLRAKRANSFELRLRDTFGNQIRTSSGTSFTITHGLTIAQSTISRSFGVALEDNAVQIIIQAGAPLPAKGTQTFVTAHEVVAGNEKSRLKIYLLEGDTARADRSIKIGEIVLSGSELKRSLPAGEPVEITYRLDESKTLSAEAMFPSIREAKQLVYRPERPALTSHEIDIEMRKEKERLADLQQVVPEKVGVLFDQQIEAIEIEGNAAARDHDAAQKAAERIIEFKKTIDALEKASEWEMLVASFQKLRNQESRIQSLGKEVQRMSYSNALKTAAEALSGRQTESLRRAVKQLDDVYWEVTLAQNSFWEEQFAALSEDIDFVDPLKAERLKEEGIRAQNRSDFSSLRTIVFDLYRLLPSWQQGKLDKRFDDAGLRRVAG